jgi:hypothetical protein
MRLSIWSLWDGIASGTGTTSRPWKELVASLLHGKFEIVQSPTLNTLEEAEFLLDIGQWPGESEMFLLI